MSAYSQKEKLGRGGKVNGQHDISLVTFVVDIAVRLGNSVQGITPIDDRSQLARLDELFESDQIVDRIACKSEDDPLGAG